MTEKVTITGKQEMNYECLDCQIIFPKPKYKIKHDGIVTIRTAYCPSCGSFNIKRL